MFGNLFLQRSDVSREVEVKAQHLEKPKTTNTIMKVFFLSLSLFVSSFVFAQKDTIIQPRNKTSDSLWSAHFQFTAVSQSHGAFKALYSGNNSLGNGVERGVLTVTSTAFIGRKLLRYTNVYANAEISGGRGFDGTTGIAGFPNGESFRVGDPLPVLSMARYYLQQHIPLTHDKMDTLQDDGNQVKEIVPASRLTISAGKFSVSDFFDKNKYSHDPRTAFLNWALMDNGSYDYPANTRGYTLGFIVEWINPSWAVRFSGTQVPVNANGPYLNKNISSVNGFSTELEKGFSINKRKGTIRILGFQNRTNAPGYKQAITEMKSGDSTAVYVIRGLAYNTKYRSIKYGLGVNGELELSNALGCFFRAGYNDGKTATWAFTEIDESVSAGLQLKGSVWKRNDDVLGIAGVASGISKDHQDYLKEGGYGFLIGDGALNYRTENIVEIYYNAKLFNHFFITADYQFVDHPAYNKDRGPVHVFSLRGHINF